MDVKMGLCKIRLEFTTSHANTGKPLLLGPAILDSVVRLVAYLLLNTVIIDN
jgi:hypothetical protein